jgi:hypothetical protein
MKTTTPAKAGKNKTAANTMATNDKTTEHLFGKENYKWMLVGLIVIAVGFILMVGGKSSDPNVFLDKEVYSVRRITIAPLLIIAGLLIEIFAIMRKPR